jgi:uncharacterized protein YlaN (UPF0358 family)
MNDRQDDGIGGRKLSTNVTTEKQNKAIALLKQDAQKIVNMISVQMDNLTMPQCPLYEEVLDTQIFGLSREIEFATRLGLISGEAGKQILSELEQHLFELHEAYERGRRP